MFFLLHLFDYSRMGKKIQIAIMIIILGIFLVPTSVLAHINLTHQSEKSSCSDNAEPSNSDCCKNHKSKDSEKKDCDGRDYLIKCVS